jgi:NADH-quinone oxidoreductase subunit N
MDHHILTNLLYFRPEMALAAAFLAALLTAVVFRKTALPVAIVAMIGLVVTAAFVHQQIDTNVLLFGTMYAVDAFGVFFKFLVLGVSFIIILFSLGSQELATAKKRLGEYYSLILAMTLGMMLMSGSTNLLFMYLSLELTSISSYILAGFTKDAKDSSEAALKYVIYGALSSGLMLYGISILYGLTGALDIYNINMSISQGNINTVTLTVSIILILAGFGYKISAVPFHFWTPDVYQGAPTAITAFLSVASKAAGFAMMIRFFKICFIDIRMYVPGSDIWAVMQGFRWTEIIAVMSVLTMTLGNLVAVWQSNMKRLLAYSSIAHAGYIMMGVVVLSNQGIAAILVYFIVYLFMNLGAFYIVMIVAEKTGSEDINEYKGLGPRSPLIGVSMAIFLLSLTGLPPTAGFIGKLYLFSALIQAKWIWLAIVGAINSVISLYYYVRIFRNIFLREPDGSKEPIRFGRWQIALVLLLVIPTVVFGLYFTPIVNAAIASVKMFGLR